MEESGMLCAGRFYIIHFIHNNYVVDMNTSKVCGSKMLLVIGRTMRLAISVGNMLPDLYCQIAVVWQSP